MGKLNFYLNRNSIVLKGAVRKNDRVEFYIGETVPATYWSKRGQRVKETAPAQYRVINEMIDKIREYANELVREHKKEGMPLSAQELEDILTRRYIEGHVEDMSFAEYAQHWIDSKPVKSRTPVRTVINRIEAVAPGFGWKDVNGVKMQQVLDKLRAAYKGTTVHKTVQVVREMIVSAKADGIFNGEVPVKWTAKYVTPDDVYLSLGEVEKLDRGSNAVRLWLLMYYSGCRYGNLKEIVDGASVQYISGQKYLRYRQVKTMKWVSIPVIGELDELLEDKPRIISNQKLNSQIKESCKSAGIASWNDVTCHTARRSCITNLVLMGMPLHLVMRISGHGTEKELMRYVKYGDLVGAIKMADDENFKMFSGVIVA